MIHSGVCSISVKYVKYSIKTNDMCKYNLCLIFFLLSNTKLENVKLYLISMIIRIVTYRDIRKIQFNCIWYACEWNRIINSIPRFYFGTQPSYSVSTRLIVRLRSNNNPTRLQSVSLGAGLCVIEWTFSIIRKSASIIFFFCNKSVSFSVVP